MDGTGTLDYAVSFLPGKLFLEILSCVGFRLVLDVEEDTMYLF